jgi:uncharacterized cysteine cluster protein YcgN (CxxCxxCC family)
MPEIKRKVIPLEINYVCDSCGKGMMEKVGEMNPKTGEVKHQCIICSEPKVFKWTIYPRIEHIGKDDKY